MAFRGALVEELAESLLCKLGYRIAERRKKVKVEGVEVAEVDLLAEREGQLYAVEVKAGRASLTDIRQAYANAVLLGAKPLIVCRGFSNDAAEVLAKKLDVEVLVLDEYLGFVSVDDLSSLISRLVEEALASFLLAGLGEPEKGDERTLEALAYSPTPIEAAKRLGVSIKELGREISKLTNKGLLSKASSYKMIRAQAALALDRLRLRKLLDAISE